MQSYSLLHLSSVYLSSGSFGGKEHSKVKLSDIHAVMNPRVGTYGFIHIKFVSVAVSLFSVI